MPAVSVIIPNYNHSKYLKERIDSVINQTFDDFEVIIMDDCSQDESRAVIENYRGHPKVREIVYNTTNSGSTFFQWKKGIELARGEWIWIAESDDWCELTLLSELYNGARSRGNCVISYCQSIMLENNNVIWRSGTKYFIEYLEGKDFVNQYMLTGNAIFNASMCIFKKQVYHKITPAFMQYKFSGDWLFWIEAALQGEVYISGKTLNYFRKHAQDVSSNAFTKGLIYVEYFTLISDFERLNIIGNRKRKLLQEKQMQFLNDQRVNQESHQRVAIIFKQHLGLSYYTKIVVWYAKSIFSIMKKLVNGVNS